MRPACSKKKKRQHSVKFLELKISSWHCRSSSLNVQRVRSAVVVVAKRLEVMKFGEAMANRPANPKLHKTLSNSFRGTTEKRIGATCTIGGAGLRTHAKKVVACAWTVGLPRGSGLATASSEALWSESVSRPTSAERVLFVNAPWSRLFVWVWRGRVLACRSRGSLPLMVSHES